MKKLIRNLLTSAAAVAVVAAAATVTPVIGSFNEIATPIATEDPLLEEFNFEANNPNGGTSTISLEAGTAYRIEAAGTFTPSSDNPLQHDPECTRLPGQPGERQDALDKQGNTSDVYVAGSEVSWIATDPSPAGCNDVNTLYFINYTPAAAGPVNLVVNDTWHGDNSGTVFVRIYEGPTTTTTTTTIADQIGQEAEKLGATGQETLNTVNGIAQDALDEQGIDPDDPNGTIDRKREEAEGTAPDPGGDPGDVTDAVEDAIEGEPDNTVGTVEDEIEDHTPNPDPDPDLGPVAEALDGALTQIGALQAGAEEEAEEMTGSELPSETPAVDDPDPDENDPEQDPDPEPTPDPDPEPEPETKPKTETETDGDSGSESTKTKQNLTPSSPVTTADSTVVPGATDGTESSNDGGAGGSDSGATGASNDTATSPNRSGDGGLLPIDFAIGEAVTDVTDEPAPRAPVSTDGVPQPTNKAVLAIVALMLLAGTSEMARRALKRFRAERVYSAYRYR